jgi:hypothetical protein
MPSVLKTVPNINYADFAAMPMRRLAAAKRKATVA